MDNKYRIPANENGNFTNKARKIFWKHYDRDTTDTMNYIAQSNKDTVMGFN